MSREAPPWIVGVGLLVFGLGTLCGGGSSPEQSCDNWCECRECTDAQLQSCEEDLLASIDAAELRACEVQYEEYLICQDEEGTCVDNQWVVEGCRTYLDEYLSCMA